MTKSNEGNSVGAPAAAINRELLEALEDAMAIFAPEPGGPHPAPKWESRARAAILKATTKPPEQG